MHDFRLIVLGATAATLGTWGARHTDLAHTLVKVAAMVVVWAVVEGVVYLLRHVRWER